MDNVQQKIANLSEAERWRLLSWLAVTHPAVVLAGLSRPNAGPLQDAAITWKISDPESETVSDD